MMGLVYQLRVDAHQGIYPAKSNNLSFGTPHEHIPHEGIDFGFMSWSNLVWCGQMRVLVWVQCVMSDLHIC
jgi:hypothetical protein